MYKSKTNIQEKNKKETNDKMRNNNNEKANFWQKN